MSIILNSDPIAPLNALIKRFRKVVKNFRDYGDYQLMLSFYQGGMRAPRIFDTGDKQKIKKELAEFLKLWRKEDFTGQIVFHLKHGEFTRHFDVYPGSGNIDKNQKEGFHFLIEPLPGEDQTLYMLSVYAK